MQRNEIIEKYLDSLQYTSITKKLFVIGLVGLPGSGKSTLSKNLSQKTGLPVLSNDHIRKYLNDLGIPQGSFQQELVQEIAEQRTEKLLENKVSHIIDADMYMFVDVAKQIVKKHGGEFLLLAVTAPEQVIKERLKQRSGNRNELSKATVDKYYQRKSLHEKENKKCDFYDQLINNGANSLEQEVDRLVGKLKQDGYLISHIPCHTSKH